MGGRFLASLMRKSLKMDSERNWGAMLLMSESKPTRQASCKSKRLPGGIGGKKAMTLKLGTKVREAAGKSPNCQGKCTH